MATKPKLNLASFTGVVSAASGTTTAPDAEIHVTLIDVERQVRTDLGDLTELVASIADIGVLEPIILLAKDGGRFRLIAGERRYRASILAKKPKVPALIKRGLTDFQVRQIQVTENNDREGLSAYDEAMGVTEDADNFGFKEALRIWNRSEGWVSKRMAVKKYADPVRELLQTKVCGDLEVLHSLNQLYGLNVNEYNALAERMRSGVTVGRDDARNKVSSVKVWMKQAEAAAKVIERPAAQPASNVADDDQADDDAGDDSHNGEPEGLERDEAAPAPAPTGKTATKAEEKKPAAKKQEQATKPTKLAKVSKESQESAKSLRDKANTALLTQRAELMEWGDVLRPHFNSMQTNMATLGYELADGEWVLWTGFLDTVLPMLASLGKDRRIAYLKRLQSDLKTQEPLAWWRELHPAAAGQDNDSDKSEREPVAEMPKGWTF